MQNRTDDGQRERAGAGYPACIHSDKDSQSLAVLRRKAVSGNRGQGEKMLRDIEGMSDQCKQAAINYLLAAVCQADPAESENPETARPPPFYVPASC